MATHCFQWPPSSGKQLFNLLLRPTASSPLLVNLEAHNKVTLDRFEFDPECV